MAAEFECASGILLIFADKSHIRNNNDSTNLIGYEHHNTFKYLPPIALVPRQSLSLHLVRALSTSSGDLRITYALFSHLPLFLPIGKSTSRTWQPFTYNIYTKSQWLAVIKNTPNSCPYIDQFSPELNWSRRTSAVAMHFVAASIHNYKKLRYCCETVRRKNMPRITEMDMEMTS